MNVVREEDIKKIISKIPYEMCEGQAFLITGANGFLARYMTDTLMYLKRNGYIRNCSIIALCRNREKAEQVFSEWLYDNMFHLLIQSVEEEISYPGKIDYIIHAASYSTTHLFESCPVDVMKPNIIGCYNLLELARKRKSRGFLFFSSGAVYGETGIKNELIETHTYEIDYLDTKNSYAVGKRTGEALCKAYWRQYGIPSKIVRISHTYGPGIDLHDGHVYSDFAKSIIESKDIVIKGDGLDSRPFCYVSDAISAFYLILFCGVNGETYNMANAAMNVTIKELAEMLTKKIFSDRGLNVIVKKKASGKEAHKVHVNTEKLEALGWKADIDLEEGFKRLVRSVEEENEMDE